ncbi:hypothetical protein ACFE04_011986 [Oxalis oulophora]
MPLLKRKPFALKDPPKDLQRNEKVYQVRFTKEIFRDYQEYLKRVNIYRQKIWMCKATAKTNLSYEEALLSEKQATEKVQDLHMDLVAPALETIQFSMLLLKDLTRTISAKLQDCFYVGAELSGKKGHSVNPCRILKILGDGSKGMQYEVAWLDRNKKTTETSVICKKDLTWKKLPFTRDTLKSFIRESTYRSFPWVLHENLARKHGISTDLPDDLQNKFCFRDGLLVSRKNKRKYEEVGGDVGDINGEYRKSKRTKEEEDGPKKEPVIYPIDDLLVQPGADDPVFTDRPSPTKDFNIPMDCVGDLLMVWDFCTSFGRFLQLSPFSFEDLENAICHKDSNSVLILESHSALFQLLLKDNNEYTSIVKKRKRKSKITLLNWAEYLCDFIEIINIPELSTHLATIRRGHYGLVDLNAKVGILRELVAQVIETGSFREKIDEHIEQRHILGATRRGEALEDARKKREEKKQSESIVNGVIGGNNLENDDDVQEDDGAEEQRNGEISLSQKNKLAKNREIKHTNTGSSKISKKSNINGKDSDENENDSDEENENEKDSTSDKESVQQLDGKNEPAEKRNKDQRREYFEREIEKLFVRTNTLGKDRHYNRYWWFQRDVRVFVESCDMKEWGYYSTKEEVHALIGSLNIKGEREMGLKKQLEKFYDKISLAHQKRSKEMAHTIAIEEAAVRRSTRVRAPPGENPANAFLKYVNKWKED